MYLRMFVTSIFLASLVQGAAALASEYLRITAEVATIRVAPTPTAQVVGEARSGDVFKLSDSQGDWYEIYMFSGEARYVQAFVAKPAASAPPLPPSTQARRNACLEIVGAQDRASREAIARHPTDVDRQIDYERLLYDTYELPIFRKYEIAPAQNSSLVIECANNRWLP